MITQPPPAGAGQVFANAFGSSDLPSTALKAIQAFAVVHAIDRNADVYLDNVFQNYFFHVAQVQSMLRSNQINLVQAANSIAIWNDARDGAILAVHGINAATAQAATKAAISAFVGVVGTAMNGALKGFL
jgi:hypothetical protein